MSTQELIAVVLIDCASLGCFTYLAYKFKKWWIALFALLFFLIPA